LPAAEQSTRGEDGKPVEPHCGVLCAHAASRKAATAPAETPKNVRLLIAVMVDLIPTE
jgi:hypothetical protein